MKEEKNNFSAATLQRLLLLLSAIAVGSEKHVRISTDQRHCTVFPFLSFIYIYMKIISNMCIYSKPYFSLGLKLCLPASVLLLNNYELLNIEFAEMNISQQCWYSLKRKQRIVGISILILILISSLQQVNLVSFDFDGKKQQLDWTSRSIMSTGSERVSLLNKEVPFYLQYIYTYIVKIH